MMLLADLGLRPSLIEEFPISFKDELKAINKAEKQIAKSKYLKWRKKLLKAELANSNAEKKNTS